jgi:hypothetical protein
MSCGCTDLNLLVNQANSIVGGCYPTPTFASGGSYAGVQLTGSTFLAGTIASGTIMGSAITGSSVSGLPTPTLSSDAATKAYADSLAFQGFDVHAAVNAATTANLTPGGGAPATLDGYTLSNGDRVLVKNQTDTRQNGIYYVSSVGSGSNGTWLRAADADLTGDLKLGAQTYVKFGTANGGSLWVMSNTAVPQISVDPINFTLAYSFFALPAAKITGQLTNSQISDLAASKLFGTVSTPYLGGSSYNKVAIDPVFGFEVGDASVNGKISIGRNGSANGVHLLLDGNGHLARLDAPLTAVNPVVFHLQNDANTTSVNISSDGTVTATGALTANSLGVSAGIVAAGGIFVSSNNLVVNTGNIAAPNGFISAPSITANNLTATGTSGLILGKDLEISDRIILAGKTIKAPGDTGAQTINEISGSVNFGSGDSSLVVTNSLVNTNSIIFVSKGTAGSHRLGAVVPAAGSFTIYMDTAHSGECRVNFLVTN